MTEMTVRLARIRDGLTPSEWSRVGAMVAVIIGLNVAGWVMLAAAVAGHYHISNSAVFGFGTGILAYTLGIRHAFDADHIAAIDNTTRKLVSEGKRPLSVGFFFSLGHSSVVFGLAVLLNFGIRALAGQLKNSGSGLHTVTNIVGTSVSGILPVPHRGAQRRDPGGHSCGSSVTCAPASSARKNSRPSSTSAA